MDKKISKESLPLDSSPTTEDQTAQSAQGNNSRNKSRLRQGGKVVVVLLLLAMVGWRSYARREYWQAVWEQGTIFPGEPQREAFAQQVAPRPQFDFSDAVIPTREIRSGGPPKDGIPALTDPKMLTAEEARYLQPDDRVIGVAFNNEARAYPLRIHNYHEIVNDEVGGLPVAVTYCPLCDSAAVFDRRTPLGKRDFGVSGLLYNSNVLLYDRGGRRESLWSQVMSQGVTGPAANKALKSVPLELTTWRDWQSRHPRTKVLSTDTGHPRNYGRSPYAGYFSTPRLMFPVKPQSDRLPAKSPVLGVWSGDESRAYPVSAFGRDRTQITDTINGREFTIQFNPDAKSLRITEAPEGVHWMYSLWFAWYAFRPQTEVSQP